CECKSHGVPLYVHVDDFADDETADNDHANGGVHKLEPDLALPEDAHHVGIHGVKSECEGDREKGENPSRKPALRGMCHHLPPQPEAFANHVCCLVQHLCEIAAAILL